MYSGTLISDLTDAVMRAELKRAEVVGQFCGLVEMLDWKDVDQAQIIERLKEVRKEYLEMK